MSCKILALAHFRREAKRLLKKFPSLKEELLGLEQLLLAEPRSGVEITKDTYKIRLAVKSKGRGKSGGMRVITHVVEIGVQVEEVPGNEEVTVFLLSIYDKSEEANISDQDLRDLIEDAQNRLEETPPEET